MSNTTCSPGAEVYVVPVDPEYFKLFDAGYPLLEYPGWEIAIKVVFYVIAIVMDLVGNVIVILIIALNRKMRSTTNVLIINLAVSDLMVGTFCMWIHLGNQTSPNWPFGWFMCKFSTFIQVTAVTSSVLTLTVISVERFIAVVYPFKQHWSPCTLGIILACVWVTSITTASPHYFMRHQSVIEWKDRTETWCGEDWPRIYKNEKCETWEPGRIVYYWFEGIVLYFLPIAVMIVTYSVIAAKLLRRKSPGTLISTTSSAQDKAKRKVTKMLVAVLIVFVICWTPQQSMLLYDIVPKQSEQPPYMAIVKYIAVFIAYFNSALNPILYGGFNENFRKGFIEAFKCILIQKRNKIGPESQVVRGSVKKPSRTGDKTSILPKDTKSPDYTATQTPEALIPMQNVVHTNSKVAVKSNFLHPNDNIPLQNDKHECLKQLPHITAAKQNLNLVGSGADDVVLARDTNLSDSSLYVVTSDDDLRRLVVVEETSPGHTDLGSPSSPMQVGTSSHVTVGAKKTLPPLNVVATPHVSQLNTRNEELTNGRPSDGRISSLTTHAVVPPLNDSVIRDALLPEKLQTTLELNGVTFKSETDA